MKSTAIKALLVLLLAFVVWTVVKALSDQAFSGARRPDFLAAAALNLDRLLGLVGIRKASAVAVDVPLAGLATGQRIDPGIA